MTPRPTRHPELTAGLIEEFLGAPATSPDQPARP